MKKYLLEYVYMDNSLLHKQYAVVEAENPKKQFLGCLKRAQLILWKCKETEQLAII